MSTASTPLVSFVVPCYNYARYLPDCLNSIFAQQGGYAFEIVAIDDCSTDNTLEVLRSYDDSRLRILTHPQNQGHLATVSEGLLASRGQFVCRIDPDDRHRPYYLAETVPVLQKHPAVGMVYGDVALIDDSGAINSEGCDRVHGGRDSLGNEFIALLKENYICAPTVLARRQAWIEALPLPAGLAFNDWYFNLMFARKYPLYYRHRVLADYRVHGANHHTKVIRDRSDEQSIMRMLAMIYAVREDDAVLEREKCRARRDVYRSQCQQLALKYFGSGMNADARRCLLQTFRYRPGALFSTTLVRLFAATFLRREWYDSSKRIWRRLTGATA